MIKIAPDFVAGEEPHPSELERLGKLEKRAALTPQSSTVAWLQLTGVVQATCPLITGPSPRGQSGMFMLTLGRRASHSRKHILHAVS